MWLMFGGRVFPCCEFCGLYSYSARTDCADATRARGVLIHIYWSYRDQYRSGRSSANVGYATLNL